MTAGGNPAAIDDWRLCRRAWVMYQNSGLGYQTAIFREPGTGVPVFAPEKKP